MLTGRVMAGVRRAARAVSLRTARAPLPPRETIQQYFARRADDALAERYETLHPAQRACNPLPCNVSSAAELSDDQGWWGFSFRDVPERLSGETFVATVPGCVVTWYRDPERANDFYPAIVTGDGRALDLREIRFRPPHAAVLRRGERPVRLRAATWVTERVYHNHSHWLTAHLPKLLLLAERNELDGVLLPQERTPAMDASLRLVGLDPASFQTFDPSRPLHVDELTLLGTDRFRPELLQLTARRAGASTGPMPYRRVFISRSRAARRMLVNEADIWARAETAGFERVHMEDLALDRQVALMRETAVLLAPHGAGLTNMLFCRPGTAIIEIVDRSFPNPNFYALASALGHRYWLAEGAAIGEGHPIDRDLRADPASVDAILRDPRLDALPEDALRPAGRARG